MHYYNKSFLPFIQKYLLCAYYMSSTVLGSLIYSSEQNKDSASHDVYILIGGNSP